MWLAWLFRFKSESVAKTQDSAEGEVYLGEAACVPLPASRCRVGGSILLLLLRLDPNGHYSCIELWLANGALKILRRKLEKRATLNPQ